MKVDVSESLFVQLERAIELLETIQRTLSRHHDVVAFHDPPDPGRDPGGPRIPGPEEHLRRQRQQLDQAESSGRAERSLRDARDVALGFYHGTDQKEQTQVLNNGLADEKLTEKTREMIDFLKNHIDGGNVILHEEKHTDHAGRTTDFKVEAGCAPRGDSVECHIQVKAEF